MEELEVIYWIIRKASANRGILKEKYFADLKKIIPSDRLFFPLPVYLNVLYSLGIIKFSIFTDQIALTEKGLQTIDLRTRKPEIIMLLLLHRTCWIFLFPVQLVFFWRVHNTTQKRNHLRKLGYPVSKKFRSSYLFTRSNI